MKTSKKKFEDFIKVNVNKIFKKNILLPFLTFEYKFKYEDSVYEDTHQVFSVKYDNRYNFFYLTSFKNAFDTWQAGDTKKIEHGLVHELCHTHTIPLSDLAKNRYTKKSEIVDEEERLNEVITQYVLRIMKLEKRLKENIN